MSSASPLTSLMDAIQRRDLLAVQRELDLGADPNEADDQGRVPLVHTLTHDQGGLYPEEKRRIQREMFAIQRLLFQAGAHGDVVWGDEPGQPVYDGLGTQILRNLGLSAWSNSHALAEQIRCWLDHGALAMLSGDTCDREIPVGNHGEPVHHILDDLEWVLYNWANEPEAPEVNVYVTDYLGQVVAALAHHGLVVHPQHDAHWEHLSDAFEAPHSLRSWLNHGHAQRRAEERNEQGAKAAPAARAGTRRRP